MRINNIYNTQQKVNNANTNFKGGREAIRLLANPDSLATTIALETSVTGGRGYNAYKRGGKNEFRERFTDDVVSAVFWMKGVDIFNKIGNFVGKNVLKLPETEFDVGKDALRTPFDNLKKNLNANDAMANKLAVFKFSKIAISSILATAFVGFALPKINQAITERLMSRNKMENNMDKKVNEKSKPINIMENHTFDAFDKRISSNNSTQSFKGVPITTVAHVLENNRIAKMLTTDVGILTGRVTTARNADEAREYFFRDSMSPFFYYASTPLIYKGLQALTGSKNLTNIDPVAAKELHNNMLEQIKQAGGSMDVKTFTEKTIGVLSKEAEALMAEIPFKDEVVALSEVAKHITDPETLKKAAEMAKLQPEQAEIGAVLTKQQVADVLKNGSINTPEFMQGLFKGKFGEALTNPLKFIPMKKITSFRNNIDEYGQAVIEAAKKHNNGIINEEILKKVNVKNFAMSAGFRAVAMGVSAFALGFAIPKLQYAITKMKTGSAAAPGLRQFEEEKK
ncbi:hypothetical protein IJ182_05220 [bacterium]|nr:hypothetical protein [bacterium]